MTWLRLVVIGIILGVIPGNAFADRAEFELRCVEVAKGLTRPNAIGWLVSIGDWYCQLKAKRGGVPVDVREAERLFHQTHPKLLLNANDIVAEDVTFSDAAKMLCPSRW